MNSSIGLRRLGKSLINIIGGVRHGSSDLNSLKYLMAPTKLQKYYLIYGGKYKTFEEIPERVSYETLHRAKSKFIIKACNCMLVFGLTCCIIMGYRGKLRASRGESVAQMNMDWHASLQNENKEKKDK